MRVVKENGGSKKVASTNLLGVSKKNLLAWEVGIGQLVPNPPFLHIL